MEIDEEKLVEHIKQAFRNKKQIKPFPPRLTRFERVKIQHHFYGPLIGKTGTVIWSEHRISTRRDIPTDWVHLIELDQPISFNGSCCKFPTCFEQDLTSLASHAEERMFLGSSYQISSDLVLDEDMQFFDGTFRTPGEFWGPIEVFKSEDIGCPKLEIRQCPNGLIAMVGRMPENQPLNLCTIIECLQSLYPGSDWQQVNGPDSMILSS
ncbi:hypothetical protein [Microbulbifer elongatus]|uniref:hypothetical protein n=1 Tax=Microbulbifer elongatus TaxID=86173 RepID=UPI001CFDEE69|nr:hypothetical protein [Microbulbifer elongatus]